MKHHVTLAVASVVVTVCLLSATVDASCGQAFCTVDSRLSTSESLGAGQLHFDLSTEYIEQDQAWVGFHPAEVGEIVRPDHQEVDATNLTWKLNTEIGLSERWSVTLLVPILHREHLHLSTMSAGHGSNGATVEDGMDGEEGAANLITISRATGVPERWNYANLGDLQLTARHSLLQSADPLGTTVRVFAGLKLPTGKTDVRNDEGEEGEITLQPGTGSVDPIVGGAVQRSFSLAVGETTKTLPTFVGVMVHAPGSDGRFGYRPGTEMLVNLGVSYPLSARVSMLGQVNFRYRDSDHVGSAPGIAKAHTGGESLFVSPGVRFALTDAVGLYSYVQVPVMQRVNGIQLASRWNLLFGVTWRVET